MTYHFIVFALCITFHSHAQLDTIVKWSEDRRLTYGDFSGQRSTPEVSHDNFDTIALIRCSFKYSFSIKDGKRVIHAYAFVDPKKSWMDEKNLDVLGHEQGHFDIAEIFARRFEKEINDTSIADIRDYLIYVKSKFEEALESLYEEQIKYDNYTLNTLGKQYYDKRIPEQLNSQPK